MSFGAELRRLRREAGLSLTDLAAKVHYSKGYLSKVETGAARPNAALAALCDTEFTTGGALASLLPADAAPRRRGVVLTPMRSGLPAVTPHFTGRAEELDQIRAALSREVDGAAAVCAVHGMAGVGKTTLAVRCAHRLQARFTDGHLFLDLRGHTPDAGEVTAAEALDRFLRFLGVPGEEIPADVDDRAALYRDRLLGRSMLIVLDNARSVRQLRPLIPAEPKCRVLITSRHRLAALDDAWHVPVSLLPRTQAIDLLAELVRDHPGGDGAEEVFGSVVDHCGRLPLAIRVAGARLRANPSWSPADLDQRLAVESARLGELDDGERSVTATFRLSYQDLPPGQRRLFGLLALHPGTDLELYSAAALADTDLRTTEALLAGLHDAHLLTHQHTGRYQFHDLLRTFARTVALPEIPGTERRVALRRLLDLTLHATDQVDRILAPQRYRPEFAYPYLPVSVPDFHRDGSGEDWIRGEWANLVALCALAARHGVHDRCWQLAFALRGFFFLTKLWDPWITTHEHALASAEAVGDTWAQAITVNNLGVATIDRGDVGGAERHYRAALPLFRTIGDENGVHTTLNNLAWIHFFRGDHAGAAEGMWTAFAFYRRTGAHRNAAIAQRGLAMVLAELGDHPGALDHATEALTAFEELGLDLDATMACNARGWIHFHAGEHEEAATAYSDALERSHRCGSTFEAARAETGLGNIAAALGRPDRARHHWSRAARQHPNLDPTVVTEARARRGPAGFAGHEPGRPPAVRGRWAY
ncbi:ATP-binding protein [Amycolatopsis cihanbeyliensis]|uniref:Tetratricopeptide repeat protein n=1 Tax=Amycolatopsis cihanbeyliensis TaxID=1128664 RepID=A0A542DD57_AMYCI|nr:helix-turn-helix domain-containing protein [Amycolatopsis cihanbeyliensis]TQJ00995.1 tetratricopeptide repeat protein [Amycolatopsis cihanbeyliensis]